MNAEGSSAGGRHVWLGQGILATEDSTVYIRDIHHHYETTQSPQSTLRNLLSFPEMQGREQKVDVAHDGTCEWFTRTSEYSTWIENPRKYWPDSIIWVTGHAGAGKSTLMKFAVEHAREVTPDELVLPHFFNARGQALEHSIEGMLRTLIVWLLDELPEAAMEQLSSPYRKSLSTKWNVPELERLLKKAVREVTRRSITFYVDALDECDEKDMDRILRVFCDIVKKAHKSRQRIRVCLASRPYPAIIFTNAISLDLHRQNYHIADIDQYIKDRLQIGNSKIAVTIQKGIRQKASGIFLWVVLVVDLLNTDFRNGNLGNLRNLQDHLIEIPDDLRSLFVYTLERYQKDRHAMLVCFRYLLFGQGHDNGILELWWMMQLGLGRSNQEIVEEYEGLNLDAIKRQIVSKTKGFVEFKGWYCQFVHESLREFILRESTLLGAEHPSEFEATSHELLREWWSSEALACQPMVLDLVPHGNEYGVVDHCADELHKLLERPLGQKAAERAVYHAEKAQECGRDQVAWLNNFSRITGPYIVGPDGGAFSIVHDLMGLFLLVGCEDLIRETQLEPTRRGRCNGLALGFRDITNERLCPALWAQRLRNSRKFSKALVDIYLHLEPRSSRLQNLMQDEALDLTLDGDLDPRYSIPLLDLADNNEQLASFFLLALTAPSTLEPHLERLERMFREDYLSYFMSALYVIIEQQLSTDAIDCMSPILLKWIEDYKIESQINPLLTTLTSTLTQMGATLRLRGVCLPEQRPRPRLFPTLKEAISALEPPGLLSQT